jgi:2-oxoisovalerate dehydrogenase E1 component
MATTIDPSRPAALDAALRTGLAGLAAPLGPGRAAVAVDELWALFEAQCESRHVDLLARQLRGQGVGYYTISSAGHESNAAVALSARPTDPALLHYRSGAFAIARSRQAGASTDPVDDLVAGMLAHVDEPIAGGRHKVLGHPETAIIPQTSTIASHLPRAVGIALAIGRSAKLETPLRWPGDAVVLCSFGDASANHSTAQGALNTAAHMAHQRLALPLLFVCEDNGLGISVRTPPGWIAATLANRPGLRYEAVDGSDAQAALATCRSLIDEIRVTGRPAVLHLSTVRFLGHAGTDVESSYRRPEELRRDFERDPILGTGRALVALGATPGALLDVYERHRRRVAEVADARRATGRELASAQEVMAPLSAGPTTRDGPGPLGPVPRAGAGAGVTLAQALNSCLSDQIERRPGLLVLGEDVGVKGGVYGVTKGLSRRFGAARVFDSLLDEQAILGVALGAAVSGLIPIPEIQYLAYLHNAEDQLRGEAATLRFFSQGAYTNGMVVRVAGYGYQRGFGGHFHNDNAIAVLRDVPGLVVATPSRPGDARGMLSALVDAAIEHGTVSVLIEPIALYHQADLHQPGDRAWLDAASGGLDPVEIGSIRRYGAPDPDVTIITWGNGLWMSLRVAARMADDPPPVHCQVIDLRWLAPLPIDAVLATRPRRILIVDETRRSGGVSEGLIAELIDRQVKVPVSRVTSKDSFVPLGSAALHVLLSEGEIEQAVRELATAR